MEETFETGNSNTTGLVPIQCSALRKGGHVMIKDFPCKIVDMSTSKTGKHGHAKVHLVGIDIFTGKKYEDNCPSTKNMYQPEVVRLEYQLVGLDDQFLTLLDAESNLKDDVRLPADDDKLCDDIRAAVEADQEYMITVLKFQETEKPISLKVKPR